MSYFCLSTSISTEYFFFAIFAHSRKARIISNHPLVSLIFLFSFFQFTSNEKYCIRQVSTELQVYEASSISESGVVGRLRLEGMTSFEVGPGEKPSVAVFFGEKKVSGRKQDELSQLELFDTSDF